MPDLCVCVCVVQVSVAEEPEPKKPKNVFYKISASLLKPTQAFLVSERCVPARAPVCVVVLHPVHDAHAAGISMYVISSGLANDTTLAVTYVQAWSAGKSKKEPEPPETKAFKARPMPR